MIEIDEAIAHVEDVAKENERIAFDLTTAFNMETIKSKECKKCANEYRQIAEWLKDYKRLKEQEPKTGRWIMKHRSHNEIKHYTGQDEMGETHTISVLERYEADEPYCSECGKRAGDTSQDYCCACGAKMIEPRESEVNK